MNIVKPLTIVLSALVAIFLLLSLFVVDETQRSIILRLGNIQTDSEGKVRVLEPGLHFKVPFVETVVHFDKRIRTYSRQGTRIPTIEKKDAIIDIFVKWRIVDFGKYLEATRGVASVDTLIKQRAEKSLRAEIGRRKLNDIVSHDREIIMTSITEDMNQTAQEELGIEIIDARIKKVDLPNEVSDAIFGLMRTERKRIAAEHRARGRSEAEAIRANADAKFTVILAEADQKSKEIRGRGDAKAANIYENAYSEDPEFFRFYRSLEAYRNTFQNQGDMLVIKPDGDFFNYFQEAQGTRKNSSG